MEATRGALFVPIEIITFFYRLAGMGAIRVFFVATQLMLPLYFADEKLMCLWKSKEQWCSPQHHSCQNQHDNTCDSQQSTPDITTIPHGNQSWPTVQDGAPCCGFCSCELDCAEFGSCCLSEYKNFKQGQKSVEKAAKYINFILMDYYTIIDFC